MGIAASLRQLAFVLRQHWRIASLVLLAVATGACNTNYDCPEPKTITSSQLANPQQSAPAATANQLVVYLDTSASMAGYVASDRQNETTFSRTLQELRNFVTLVNPPLDVLVRRVDVRVGEPLNDMILSQASVNSGLFNGADTDLAGAVNSFEQSTSNNAPARFHILVTDGVQSTNQDQPNLACTSGSDQLCVRRKVFELLNSGWGGYVLGLRSQFHGNIYSEINRAQRRPSTLRFDTDDGVPETFRPFYLYIFSPDRSALDPFVTTLINRLSQITGAGEASVHVLPLTSAYVNGITQAEAKVEKASLALLVVRKKPVKDLPEFVVAVDPDTSQKGPQTFSLAVTLPWARNTASGMVLRELAGLISWKLVPVYPKSLINGARYPEIKLTGQAVDDEGHIQLQATAQWPSGVGKLCWRGYRLEGRLKPEAMTPQWVRSWSTNLDTTIENANKTLYLETALLGLWRNSVLNDQLVAEIALIVGER